MSTKRSRLRGLSLEGFKGFEKARAQLGDFTVIVGTNASGKSNLRDALRFLHGVSRGYTLAETIGEKWIEAGVLQWRGLRGGIREVSFDQAPEFHLAVDLEIPDGARQKRISYRLQVDLSPDGRARLAGESLVNLEAEEIIFELEELRSPDPEIPFVTRHFLVSNLSPDDTGVFGADRPCLPLLAENSRIPAEISSLCREVRDALSSFRFLDLVPDAMRLPSLPGQLVLGDRGENLSSVLQEICATSTKRAALVNWVRALTLLDVVDCKFVADQTGKILVTLIESTGRETSAHSASDGTLRFLAMIAAFLGSDPARLYFFEELETGLHPTRLHLLLSLIEREARSGASQVLATTHSPQLLTYLEKPTLEEVLLTYRKEGELSQRIVRLLDLPHAREVLESQDIARLHASGWLEDAVAFAEDSALP